MIAGRLLWGMFHALATRVLAQCRALREDSGENPESKTMAHLAFGPHHFASPQALGSLPHVLGLVGVLPGPLELQGLDLLANFRSDPQHDTDTHVDLGLVEVLPGPRELQRPDLPARAKSLGTDRSVGVTHTWTLTTVSACTRTKTLKSIPWTCPGLVGVLPGPLELQLDLQVTKIFRLEPCVGLTHTRP